MNLHESKYYAEIKLSQKNSGKVDTGMKVQLRFDAYPDNEAGSVPGNLVLFFDETDALFNNSTEPSKIAERIESLSKEKKITTVFWCKEDCQGWLKGTKHIVLK